MSTTTNQVLVDNVEVKSSWRTLSLTWTIVKSGDDDPVAAAAAAAGVPPSPLAFAIDACEVRPWGGSPCEHRVTEEMHADIRSLKPGTAYSVHVRPLYYPEPYEAVVNRTGDERSERVGRVLMESERSSGGVLDYLPVTAAGPAKSVRVETRACECFDPPPPHIF